MDDGTKFYDFAKLVASAHSQSLAHHHEILIKRLQAVVDGECDRLMIHMPPGSAKSTFGSTLFPAFYLGRHPTARLIATSHTASLASYFGRSVRNTLIEYDEILGVGIAAGSRGAADFSTNYGGQYFASGVRGPITGRRADLILIDDPIKSWAEAESLASRDALYDWYRAELTARLKPRGRIVLIMTRWHDDDLAARIVRTQKQWSTLSLPALAGPNDEHGRAENEALWPEWQTKEDLDRIRRDVGEVVFAAMYQQQPIKTGTKTFKIDKIKFLDAPIDPIRTIRAWDFASTEANGTNDPDYTVGLKLGITSQNQLVVLDVARFRAGSNEVNEQLRNTARRDGGQTIIAIPQDPGQAGAAQIAFLTRDLVGYKVISSTETGPKTFRARAAAAQIEAGNLAIVRAAWNDVFLSELNIFPGGGKDDQVDALSRAVNTIATLNSEPARRVNAPIFSR